MPQSQVLQNSKTDSVTTKSIDFSGRQITNAGNAVNPQDYITLSQAQGLISAAIPATTTNRTQININGIVKSGQPGAILFVGNQGQLSQDSANFNYAGTGKLNLVGINISSLTISKPTKTDASKNLVSGLIVLTTDVSGILPVPNGGSGAATFTANAVLLGNGAGAFQVQAGVSGSLTIGTSNGTVTVGVTTGSIQYKDWTDTNQTATFVTSVSLGGTVTFLTAATVTSNAFTNGVRTT